MSQNIGFIALKVANSVCVFVFIWLRYAGSETGFGPPTQQGFENSVMLKKKFCLWETFIVCLWAPIKKKTWRFSSSLT